MRANQPAFRYLAISEQTICPEPVPDRIQRLYQLGVSAIQVRDKELPDRQKLAWLSKITRGEKQYLLINSRADIARLSNANGIHLSQTALSNKISKKIAGDEVLTGLSTHTLTEAINAVKTGVDYITFGPIFPTPSKPDLTAKECPGIEELKKVAGKVEIPVFALGGVGPEKVEECLAAGAAGIAGIRALFGSREPEKNWKKIKRNFI